MTTAADAERFDLARVRALRGRTAHPWIRRALLALVAVPIVLALTGAIGQAPRKVTATAAGADLRVEVPDVLRGGLLSRARIVVRAKRAIDHPRIILGAGFFEGMQVNTIEPSPQSEAARRDHVVLSYPPLTAGDELVVYVQLQVNPTTLGEQDTGVELDNESNLLARVVHTTTVLP